MDAPIQLVERLLADFGTVGEFATRFAVDADPQLHVEGVGPISLPVTVQDAHRLCAVARPALHGYKGETRLDRRVRDTWEIPGDRVRFASPEWPDVLAKALQRVHRDLGLPRGAQLSARLHNLLAYSPGQFFAAHQDSEAGDGMLGTLIVILPSRFSGGEFAVSHQGQTLRARTSAKRLGILAFYADCHHEVSPVKQGYRVVLTYQLTASDASPVEISDKAVTALANAVQGFWDTPPAARWSGDTASEVPDRLVYLLDYQYTQRGLSWRHLKGSDAARAEALRAVAERLDAEIFLALADVHETWAAEPDYSESRRWRHGEDEDDDDPGAGSADEPALSELIDSDIELRHWLNADGSLMASEPSFVAWSELCETRPSVECSPFESEYEGYMGNYGNTVDRWYHRAAIVMWPRKRAFVIRARLSPAWAVEQMANWLAAGDAKQALACAREVQPFWDSAARRFASNALLDAILPVAARLDDDDVAAGLLAPFSLQHLTPGSAPKLLDLLERHGLPWCIQRLEQWAVRLNAGAADEQLAFLATTLPKLTHAWSAAAIPDGRALAAVLVEQRWDWLRRHITAAGAQPGSAGISALVATGSALLGLIRGTGDAQLRELQQHIVGVLCAPEWPPQLPLAVLHAAAVRKRLDEAARLGLVPLYAHSLKMLAERLAQPARAASDWAVPRPAAMSGALQAKLAGFLDAPDQKHMEWPIAQAHRQVIHEFIDRHELPVRHETRRQGRPYTLVLDKTPALFEREAAERYLWQQELVWLQQHAIRFAEKCQRE